MRLHQLLRRIEKPIIGLLCAAFLLPVARKFPNPIVLDDAYFYLQIAYNIGHQAFSSFDSIHPTGGYHLLWGACLGFLAFLTSAFTTSKVVFLYVSLAAAATAVAYIASIHFDRTWQRLAVVALLLWTASMTEAILLTLLLLYIFDRVLHHVEDFLISPLDVVAVAFIPLTRIDASIIPATLCLFFFFVDRRKFAILAACTLIGLAVQLAAMKLMFGHVFSVSSMILWERTHAIANLGKVLFDPESPWRSNVSFVAFLSTVLLAALVFSKVRKIERMKRILIVASTVACLSFIAPHYLFGAMREWYWTAPLVALYYLACRAGDDGSVGPIPALKIYSIVLCAIVAIDLFAGSEKYRNAHEYNARLLDYVNRNIPASESIFQEDASGFMGFWSRPHIVNGDGMVNSYEYMRRMHAGELGNYLEEEGICFLIRNWPPGEDERIVSNGGLSVTTRETRVLLEPPQEPGVLLPTQLTLYLLTADRCRRFAGLAGATG